jgi:adenylate cyclase
MDARTRNEIHDWVARAAVAGMPLRELVEEFCRRLVAGGIPLQRLLLGASTLHPTLDRYFFEWESKDRNATQFDVDRARAMSQRERWFQSPFFHLANAGEEFLRRRLARGEGREFPIVPDLLADGATDYVVMRHAFTGENAIHTVDAAYSSWTTAQPQGFTDSQVEALRALAVSLSLAVKSASFAQIARNIADAYLGRDIGARILAGEIVRGAPEKIDAVVWFSDLEAFTRISDTSEPDQIIHFLNDYAEAIVGAIQEMKGEVLKFMGDGVLALFRGADAETTCRHALGAVQDARRRVAELNTRRAAANQPTTRFYLGLHAGEVFFGNIGSVDRLDFTAVGTAVNEASRIAAMCRSLDQEVLTSSAFAARAGDLRVRLLSCGRYALRGVARPTELFTLDPEVAS